MSLDLLWQEKVVFTTEMGGEGTDTIKCFKNALSLAGRSISESCVKSSHQRSGFQLVSLFPWLITLCVRTFCSKQRSPVRAQPAQHTALRWPQLLTRYSKNVWELDIQLLLNFPLCKEQAQVQRGLFFATFFSLLLDRLF